MQQAGHRPALCSSTQTSGAERAAEARPGWAVRASPKQCQVKSGLGGTCLIGLPGLDVPGGPEELAGPLRVSPLGTTEQILFCAAAQHVLLIPPKTRHW